MAPKVVQSEAMTIYLKSGVTVQFTGGVTLTVEQFLDVSDRGVKIAALTLKDQQGNLRSQFLVSEVAGYQIG